MTIKAAQYVRMSTDQQPLSIDTQKVAIAEYAGKRGMQIVQTYADEGKSGITLAGRPALQQLLHEVTERNCPFTVILVLDVSRWGRFQDTDEAAYYEWHCRKHGVGLEYVSEPFPVSNSPLDSILKQLKRAMAAEYSRELGLKCRAGQIQAVKLGYASGNPPCIGYRRQAVSLGQMETASLLPGQRKPRLTDRVRWILGPTAEVDAVRRVFEQFISGVAILEIAAKLNYAGMTSHDGRAITAAMIRTLLASEVVSGTYAWGRHKAHRDTATIIPALAESVRNFEMVPAIITREVWDRVQIMLDEKAWIRHLGTPRHELVEKLRHALQLNPPLRGIDFLNMGLATPDTYRRHFGSLRAAYAAAGRKQGAFEKARSSRSSTSQTLRQRFLADLFVLLQRSGIPAERQSKRNVIVINGVEVKIRAAREIPSANSQRWSSGNVQHLRASNRWLLVMRLNEDDCTGKDFFLLPPQVHQTFAGTFNSDNLPNLERFRLPSAEALLERLNHIEFLDTLTSLGQGNFEPVGRAVSS